jgi:glycosyltransferase involved in cell wall biosynthesis
MTPRFSPSSAPPVKIDLHCHSHASADGAEAVLESIGCPECYSKPDEVYAQARSRGMDFVTITDHDTIAGVQTIIDRHHVIAGEELTCWFPEDGCKMHVLVWGITAQDHAHLQSISKDIYACADYIERRQIAHAVAHPLYRQNDKLERWHVERLILMFKGFECLNGAHSALHRTAFEPLLNEVSRQKMQELAEKHGMLPRWPEPWFKSRTAGSDDHGLLNIGRTWTEFPPDTKTIDDVLQCLREGACQPAGEAGSSVKLAHNFYSVAVRYFGRKFLPPGKNPNVGTMLMQTIVGERRLPGKAKLAAMAVGHGIRAGVDRLTRPFKSGGDGAGMLTRLFTRSARRRFPEHPKLKEALLKGLPPLGEHQEMFKFVAGLNHDVTAGLVNAVGQTIDDSRFVGIFDCISAAMAQQFMLMPYYFSLFHQNRERDVLHRLTGFNPPPTAEAMKVALFTDTFDEPNAVARSIRDLARQSVAANRNLVVHTCSGNTPKACVNRKNFTPTAAWPMPHAAGLPLTVPPVLEILEWCDRQQFDAVHIATTGPMGVVGWLAARMLKVPVLTTHPIDINAAVNRLTDDMRLADAAGGVAGWLHRAAAISLAPARGEATTLKNMGIAAEKIAPLPASINGEIFNPDRRDVNLWADLGVARGRRLVFAGPYGADKETGLLARALHLVCDTRSDVALIVLADGPAVAALKSAIAGLPVVQPKSDEQTAAIYAGADLLLAPSLTASPWQAVLEAQSAGLPVLVARGGVAEEFMSDCVTGLSLPADAPHDASAWAVAINRLLDDDTLRLRMARTGHQRAGRFSPAKTFEAFWSEHAAVVAGIRPEPAAAPATTAAAPVVPAAAQA